MYIISTTNIIKLSEQNLSMENMLSEQNANNAELPAAAQGKGA